jgi:hypothetical protein
MSGVQLKELECSEMLDVLHYMFEEDSKHASAEEAENVSKIRTSLYRHLYDREYKFEYSTPGTRYNYNTASGAPDSKLPNDGYVSDDADAPLQPDKGPTKAFVPATEFNPDSPMPFGRTLDPPSGL